ncbi:hypothetical protein D3C81_1986790 [compost metagenome]
MVQHVFVDASQQIGGQGDVEFLRLAQVFADVDVDQGPGHAGILWVARMVGHLVGWRNRRTVLGQDLEVPLDGFTRHGDGIVQVITGREAPRNIRHFHAPGVLVIAF